MEFTKELETIPRKHVCVATGTEVISVPFCTSQLCCGCNAYVRKDLSIHTRWCWYCGLELNRNLNESVKVLKSTTGCTALDIIRKPQGIRPRTIVFTDTLV